MKARGQYPINSIIRINLIRNDPVQFKCERGHVAVSALHLTDLIWLFSSLSS